MTSWILFYLRFCVWSDQWQIKGFNDKLIDILYESNCKYDFVTFSFLSLFCSATKTKNQNQKSESWRSGKEKCFCFIFIVSWVLLQRNVEFNPLLQSNFLICYSSYYYNLMRLVRTCVILWPVNWFVILIDKLASVFWSFSHASYKIRQTKPQNIFVRKS